MSAAILLTFLLGIGFGTLFAHRLWRYLWLLEACIGLFGVGFALSTDLLDEWLYAALPLVGPGIGASIFVCFLLLCLPAFAIGTSLPLFAGYLGHLNPGRVFARAYTIYNFGAALTVLLIEFVLLRMFGLSRAILLVASINGFVAIALLLGYGGIRNERPAPSSAARYPVRLLVALALASVASAVFQLLMVKVAECVLGPFRETFALVLAVIFLGIAVGSTVTERLRLSFGTLMILALVGLLGLVAGFPLVVRLYAWFYPWVSDVYRPAVSLYKLFLVAWLMGLPAMAFGATIPALLTVQRNVARESGQLLFVSSVANAAGFLVMALALHRFLDYGVIFLVIAAMSAVAALVYYATVRPRAVAAAVLLLAAALAYRGVWDETLLYLGHTSFDELEDLEETRAEMQFPEKFKGFQDVFSINWKDGDPWFFINGYVSIPLNSPSEKLVGAFSSVFAPDTGRALVLGVGSGATAGTVGLLFDKTDAVEISPVILKNLFRMKDYNFDIESMPGVRIIQDDGIHFVKSSREKYSLIINTVTTPLYFSSSKLYTRDFLDSVRDRLLPEGIYVTWMDSRVGTRGAEIIMKTLGNTFEHCWLGAIKSTYYLILCSQEPIAVRQPEIVDAHPVLGEFFYREHGLPPRWIPFGVLSTRPMDTVESSSAPLNTLDFPALEFEMARLASRRGYIGFMKRVLNTMSVGDISEAMASVPGWDPIHLLLYAEGLIGEDTSPSSRWRKLMKKEIPEFDTRYADEKLRYLATAAERSLDPDAYEDYGEALTDAGRTRDAVEAFAKALELDPGGSSRHFDLGKAYERDDDFERAREHYLRELEVRPDSWRARYRLGVVYVKVGRYRDSLTEFNEALAIEERAEPYVGRGRALEALGDLDAARRAYLDALRVKPDFGEAREGLARLGGAAPFAGGAPDGA